jgi:hypothetical protein
MPLPELAERNGGLAEDAPARATGAREEPSLPFSGFSLFVLALSGAAAVTGGRRLHTAAESPAPPPVTEVVPVPERPHSSGHRAPLYVGAALLGIAVLVAARGTR